jgi:pyruvate,orthophosphate dikinase
MKEISSKALEANIAEYNVDVCIDSRYHVIQEVMSKYEGLKKTLNTFLEELCHPRRNWQFIVSQARTYSTGYFFDLKTHPKGPDAVRLYIEIAVAAIKEAKNHEIKSGAFSNFYLLLQRLIKESAEDLERFLPVINFGFNEIENLDEELFPLIAKNYYQLNRLGAAFLRQVPETADFKAVNDLMIKFYSYTFSYWLSENDPREWFESEISQSLPSDAADLFGPVSHLRLKDERTKLDGIIDQEDAEGHSMLEKLLELPGYGNIADMYKSLPDEIYNAVEGEKLQHQCKLVVLFHTMNIPGLSSIHEDTLRDINRDIEWLMSHEDVEHIQSLIEGTFNILRKSADIYPDTVLKAVLNMGRGVYKTDERDLVHFFNECVVRLGFQPPEFRGISDDWQIQSNMAHMQNIRTWMELVELNPMWSVKLLSSLIIHLTLSGVLIKDTDLFPRDITGFLNSDIRPVYNLAKQLMRLFPAYFNEIGAEGQLRDISTDLDELCSRKDRLVHFLRKQSHVESSNKIISLIESALECWRTKSKEGLKTYLPPNIYDQVEPEGEFVDGVSKVINHIFETKGLKHMTELLSLEDDYVTKAAVELSEVSSLDIKRVSLAINFYKLLNQKYCVSGCEIEGYIAQVQSTIPLNLNGLKQILDQKDTYKKISDLLEVLQQLKDIILLPEPFEIREDIYRKRHIAAEIPSMYGSYREAKFDALGLTFRLEFIVNTLFEELVEDFDPDLITRHTFYRIYKYLRLFNQALNIDGIPAREFENQLELFKQAMKIKLFTFSQYLDIFRSFTQVVRNIVSDYFNNIHEQNLEEIFERLDTDTLLPKYVRQSDSRDELFLKVSEIFLKDTIASSLGLQRLDLFLTRISNTLHEQAEKFPADKHYLLLTYDPRNIVSSITEPDNRLLDIIHLGNKGFNMIRMKSLGLPVPPGFIVTTELVRCIELIDTYPPANADFRNQIERETARLEKRTGRKFGSPEKALLVSVRSGAAISQPGMMDSYLNVGMNEDIVQGIIKETGEAWFAWDCYRRFLQSYGMSFGLARDEFDAIIENVKLKYGVMLKKDLAPEYMKDAAMAYREFIRLQGIEIAESPSEQLYIAIDRVLNSWNSSKAQSYRKIIGISDDWGTAVTVQQMIFGNLSQQSGSGVFFTHSPKFSPEILRPWGDYTIGNQGEDVVSGLVSTYPVSVFQAKMENRSVEDALEKRFPEIYRALRDVAGKMIYDHQWAPQDIEFTFEGPRKDDLYILQTRDMEMRERMRCPSFQSTAGMEEKFLAHGIGVSGGALSGRAVFCLDDMSQWKKSDPGTPLILIRNDTVPDDIREISAADGLLTARGGATSHAAIVANRLDKTCVVGCRDLVCYEREKKFVLKRKTIRAGEFVSIDGYEGSIYAGKMEISKTCS